MRELFVYYRVTTEQAAQALVVALAMQARLQRAQPPLRMRLLRRPEAVDGQQTWMETYATDAAAAPEGIDARLQAIIETAAVVLQPWIAGARHTEVFISCAS